MRYIRLIFCKLFNKNNHNISLIKKHTPKYRNWTGEFPKTPGRLIGLSIIRVYQLIFSNIFGNSCRYLPTCSEYGHEAIARYGLWIGGWLTFFRFIRCNPLGSHGFDPVPDDLNKKTKILYLWKKRKMYF